MNSALRGSQLESLVNRLYLIESIHNLEKLGKLGMFLGENFKGNFGERKNVDLLQDSEEYLDRRAEWVCQLNLFVFKSNSMRIH